MTPEQIQRLRELEAKATGGKWATYEIRHGLGIRSGTAEVIEPCDDICGPILDDNDAEFTVEARNALPDLLDDWERMWQQTESLLCVGDQLDALLKDVADSPVVHEHHQGKYVEIQVDGPTWQRLRRFRDFDVLDPPSQPVT